MTVSRSIMAAVAQAFEAPIEFLEAGGPGSGCHGDKCGRPRDVQQQFQTTQGHTYTLATPSRRGMKKGQHRLQNDPLRGKYKVARDEQNRVIKHESKSKDPLGMRYSNVFDAKWGRGDKYEGHGKTVFVHRDFKNMRVVIQEVPHDEMQHSAMMKQWRFKNFGTAAGFLNKRYGIRWRLPSK
jgi:hypothetical protein